MFVRRWATTTQRLQPNHRLSLSNASTAQTEPSVGLVFLNPDDIRPGKIQLVRACNRGPRETHTSLVILSFFWPMVPTGNPMLKAEEAQNKSSSKIFNSSTATDCEYSLAGEAPPKGVRDATQASVWGAACWKPVTGVLFSKL